MAFPRINATPTAVETVRIILEQNVDEAGETRQTIEYRAEIMMSDGSRRQAAGNLMPHLTAAQKTQLSGFLTAMFDKAAAEIL